MEVGGTLTGSEILGRTPLKGVDTRVEVVIWGREYIGMLERVVEIGIEGSTVVEGGGYPNSWAHFVKDLASVLIRWDIPH